MNEKRQLAAAILFVLAFAFWLGAVGNADFNGSFLVGDYIRLGVGLICAIAAFPVSGDLRQGNEESEDFEDD